MNLMEFLNFNPSRYYLYEFIQEAAIAAQPGNRVLDAGAGDSPYRDLFRHTQYDAADLGVAYETSELTYICDLAFMPVQSNTYDLILCTQVLEHVKEPSLTLRELGRLLKPGGKLWLSAPLFYAEHQIPHDYYRYTQYGLVYLLESAGFEVNELRRLEGYWGTLAYQCRKSSQELPLELYPTGWERYPLIPLMLMFKFGFAGLSVLFAHLDVRYKLETVGYCKNYILIATKL
jgi:SAM-dependent methyltransferase